MSCSERVPVLVYLPSALVSRRKMLVRQLRVSTGAVRRARLAELEELEADLGAKFVEELAQQESRADARSRVMSAASVMRASLSRGGVGNAEDHGEVAEGA